MPTAMPHGFGRKKYRGYVAGEMMRGVPPAPWRHQPRRDPPILALSRFAARNVFPSAAIAAASRTASIWPRMIVSFDKNGDFSAPSQ